MQKDGFMKKLYLIFALIAMFGLMSGCSVYMATKQPDQKNLHVLDQSTPRNYVISELGPPMFTRDQDGKLCDVLSFVQGYSKGAKVTRAVFHGTADAFTLGIWEVIGTPFESYADGTPIKVEVYYDDKNCVDFIKVIQGEEELKDVTSFKKAN
jgi:hypothetical protein